LAFHFEHGSREFRLSDNARHCAAPEFSLKRNWNGYSRRLQALLHDPMAASLAHS